MSLPAREEWIEILQAIIIGAARSSLPAREEWIEIEISDTLRKKEEWVSSREGRVD